MEIPVRFHTWCIGPALPMGKPHLALARATLSTLRRTLSSQWGVEELRVVYYVGESHCTYL